MPNGAAEFRSGQRRRVTRLGVLASCKTLALEVEPLCGDRQQSTARQKVDWSWEQQ
jgi:hypothetical protein